MTLAGKRILIVEDEYMIAVDLKRELLRQGAEVVGPTGDLEEGLELADGQRLDAALLDLNLEGDWSYPIADRLDGAGVPYLFVTGYDPWALPDAYADKPAIAKPYALTAVVDRIATLCGTEDRL